LILPSSRFATARERAQHAILSDIIDVIIDATPASPPLRLREKQRAHFLRPLFSERRVAARCGSAAKRHATPGAQR